MPAKKDLTGQTFNRLTVIEQDMNKYAETQEVFWKCRCSCGNFKSVRTYDLTHGKTKSCGCLRNEKVREAIGNKLQGQRFGRLLVLEQVESIIENSGMVRTAWKCKCDCGNIITVKTINLKSGDTHSCGCMNSRGETLIESILRINNIRYSQQYVFNDLTSVNGGHLRFDFAVFDNNNLLKYLIEFNGIQHYQQINFFGEDRFETQQENDNRKKQYCLEKNIPLIIIPYWELKNINLEYIERKVKDSEEIYRHRAYEKQI